MNKNTHSLNSEQERLFEILVKDKQDDWKTYSKRTNIKVWKGIVEKYPETAHFIYELIQNADDTAATDVKILLFKDKLVFKHNGKRQFSITDAREQTGAIGDINSITSVGCSTKEDEEQTIGKFGVGFKSVFQYTNTPSIYDDTFWFKIENYIIPSLLENDNELRNAGETLFELPFKEPEKAYSEILQRLQNLNMPVLFLPHIQKIAWCIEGEETIHEYSKEVIQMGERHGIKYEFCRIHEYDKNLLMYLFHRDCNTIKGKYNVSVGFYVNPDGSLDIDAKGQIYCFFPTSECFDSCFVSHAPFLLVDNRDSIKRYEDINKNFFYSIAELAADALLCLRDIGECRNSRLLESNDSQVGTTDKNILINDNIFHVLNIKPTEYRDTYLKQCYLRKVKENKLLLNRSKRYASINDVFSTTIDLENLISSSQIAQLCQNNDRDFLYLKQYRSDFKEVEAELKVKPFDNECLAKLISKSFMASQPLEWTHRLLTYIEEKARILWRSGESRNIYATWQDSWSNLKFRFAPIAKTQSGEWACPYCLYKEEANVCFPYSGFKDVETNAFGKVLDKEIFEKHEDLFRGMGIKEPDMADYLEKTLLVRYKKNDIPTEEVLLKDFAYIYKLLNANASQRIKDILKKEWKLKRLDESRFTLCNLSEMYIPTTDFLNYTKGGTSFNFVDCDFYTKGTDLSCSEVGRFLELYFDVSSKPKVREVMICSYSYRNFPESIIDFLDNQKLAVTKSQSFKDYQLEGYDINICSKDWSHALWRFVCENGIGTKENGKLSYFLYRERSCHVRDWESSYYHNLKNDRWIVKADGTYCSPGEITIDEFHQLGYERKDSVEQHLTFLDGVLAEKTKKEREEKEEQDKINRENCLKIINKNCSTEALESIAVALENGVDIKEALNESHSSYGEDNHIGFDSKSKLCSYSDGNTSLIPNIITSNLESLVQIADKVGADNLPVVADHVDDIVNWIIDEDKAPSMVRRIVDYIGKKIYEQYLVNEGVKYESISNSSSDCDFNINDGEKYVTVISTLKSIANNNIPVGISASQNVFLRNHPNTQIRIVRISLSDISILPHYNHIVGLYGKEDEPDFNERLRKDCDELAINYWKGAAINEFDAVSPEYSVKVERKNKR